MTVASLAGPISLLARTYRSSQVAIRHKTLPLLGSTVMLASLAAPATATEGGGTSKALGVDTVMSGVIPPPGLRLTSFLARYDTNHTLDSSGDDRAAVSNFDLYANAATFRLQYVWSRFEPWGANIETRVGFSTYVDAGVSLDVKTPGGSLHRSGSASGIGDALFAPAVLGWHGKRFHQMVGPEFFLPTGGFDKTKIVNTSRGYLSVGPAYWFTWFPNDATEISGSLVQLINSTNHETNYKSGNEISFDYGVGHALTPKWQVGVSGCLYKQIADDQQNGKIVGDGNRGQAAAVGPFVRYRASQKWGLTVKWQHEALVENKTSGDRLVLQVMTTLF